MIFTLVLGMVRPVVEDVKDVLNRHVYLEETDW